MIEMKCHKSSSGKHEWEPHTDASWTVNGPKPTYLMCKHCKKLIIASEWAQLKGIENQTTSTRVLIITTIIAFAALIVSLISLYLNYTGKI